MEKKAKTLALTDEQRAPFVEIGKVGAARRARVAHTCAICGVPFEGLRQARYCSNRCAVRASRQRRQERSEPDESEP